MALACIRGLGFGLVVALAACSDQTVGADPQAAPQYRLDIEACEPAEGVVAECGRLYVPEDRSDPTSRRIPIYFIRARATGEAPRPDPVFILTGGPGDNASDNPGNQFRNSPYLEGRDVVLVDQRGVGKSNRLDCVQFDLEANPDDLLTIFDIRMFEPSRFHECLPKLEAAADLTKYTTTIIAQDINDVRAALAYDKINLAGASYGTTLALEYVRRHGDSVRSAVLRGVAAPSVLQNATLAKDLDDMSNALLASCEKDAACDERFPTFRRDFHAILQGVKQAPVSTQLAHPITQEPIEVDLDYTVLTTALRYYFYSVDLSASLPLYVELAMQGDFGSVAGLAPRVLLGLPNGNSEGMWASVRCAEEIPYLDVEAARALSQDTIMGPARLDDQIAICDNWPRGAIPADFHEAVVSDVPVLLLAGGVDAAAPPWMARSAAETLSNGRLVIAANRSHWDLGGECLQPIINQFIEAPELAQEIDASCAENLERPPFVLTPPEAP